MTTTPRRPRASAAVAFSGVSCAAVSFGVAIASHASAGIGYDVSLDFAGVFDQAVVYTNLFDIPGSAVFVDQAGGVSIGDTMNFEFDFRVTETGGLEFGSMFGTLPGGRTFGDPPLGAAPFEFMAGVRDGAYRTAGETAFGHDLVRATWRGNDDGINEFGLGAAPLTLELVLLADPGTLVSSSGRVLATDFESFQSAITGAHLRLSYPNAFSFDAFITDPDVTIVPAPAGLSVLLAAAGGVFAARRRR